MGMTKMSYPNANGHAFKPSKRDPKLCAAVIGGFICAHKADHPRHAAAGAADYTPTAEERETARVLAALDALPPVPVCAAALADVAELRMMIRLHMNAASSLQVEARERLDRIEQALRQR